MTICTCLWLNGTVGSGKTTVGRAVADHLAARGEAVAFIDIDALATMWPRSSDDPFNVQLVAKNLAAVAANFSAAGARTLVIAGVIQTPGDLELHRSSIGVPMTVVRLVVEPHEVEARLHQRHGELDPDGLRWHAARAPDLAAILDEADLPMIEVSNAGDLHDTARAVLVAAGWGAPIV